MVCGEKRERNNIDQFNLFDNYVTSEVMKLR